MLSVGMSFCNPKFTVPKDVIDNFLLDENLKTSDYLMRISAWSVDNFMSLNTDKTKYMIIKFCSSHQF